MIVINILMKQFQMFG